MQPSPRSSSSGRTPRSGRRAAGSRRPSVIKRDPNGHYTWEIKGEDAEEVIAADRRLREYMRGK